MEIRMKVCRQCKTENSPDSLYCSKCGRYLSEREESGSPRMYVWETSGTEEEKETGDFFITCPDCGFTEKLSSDVLPMNCSSCGYFFQAGVDTVQRKAAGNLEGMAAGEKAVPRKNPPSGELYDYDPSDRVTPPPAAEGMGPLGKAKADTKSLSLLTLNGTTRMPVPVRPAGEIFGGGGTIFTDLSGKVQISFWHTPAGWYAKTLAGEPLFNGKPMPAPRSRRLEDADIIYAEGLQIKVELYEA